MPWTQSFSHGCGKVSTRAACTPRPNGGRTLFQAHLRGWWQASASPWLLATGLSQFPAMWASAQDDSQQGSLLFPEQTGKRARAQDGKKDRGPGIFNLVLEVTSHHVHCILLVRIESLGPVYAGREEVTQRHGESFRAEGHQEPLQRDFVPHSGHSPSTCL